MPSLEAVQKGTGSLAGMVHIESTRCGGTEAKS